MAIPFIKMQGIGNDYVYVDAREREIGDESALARAVSDRHFGVGSDGLILIKRARAAAARHRMHMYNSDGSEAEMCGNGLRCVAKYLFDRGLERETSFPIETGAGILTVNVFPGSDGKVERVRVNMGEPRTTRGDIPMTGAADAQAIDEELPIDGAKYRFTAVSMGNPHCVIFVENVREFPLAEIGPLIERHALFPRRVNVEFVEVVSRREFIQRTWERGAGETLACGTGASAVCVAGVLTGRGERRVKVRLRGGELEIEWNEADNHVSKTGPAVEVFRGEWPEA